MNTNKAHTSKELLGHAPCFECGSSDAMACYDDHSYCYSCNKSFLYNSKNQKPTTFVDRSRASDDSVPVYKDGIRVGPDKPTTLMDRKVSAKSLEFYDVTLEIQDGVVKKHFYPYTDKDGVLCATKVRICDPEKDFFISGDIRKGTLFGQSKVKGNDRYITICEGELDAISFYELTGFPAVSVKSASQALKDCKENFDFLNSFENVILCFDQDVPGQKAANDCARLFKAGKVKIVNLAPLKDVNEYLMEGKRTQFEKAWWNAATYQLDGIVPGNTLWEIVSKEETYQSVPYPYKGLNDKLYGFRTSEMITVTAGTGVGKTTFLKALAVWIKENTPPDQNIGLLMLEETVKESSTGLMSVVAGKPFHIPTTSYTMEEKREAYMKTLGSGKFFFHDHFGSTSIDNIIDKVHKLVTQYDCRYIILDHISIIVSDQQNGDERRALDEIATKLKTFCVERDVCLFIVCHLKRVNGKPAEEGGQISLSDIRGTAGIGQLSNIILALERNTQASGEESSVTNIRVLKNRFAGKTGIACSLSFDYDNYRFVELDELAEQTELGNPSAVDVETLKNLEENIDE